MEKNIAYSIITIKALDEERREFTGIASTPEPDRVHDIMVPKGARFKLPMPFLWQHDSQKPVGEIYEAKVTNKGIEVKGRIMKVNAPSQLAARLDEAWVSMREGLVRGLSIGFKAVKYSIIEETGGIQFEEWDWYELSGVTIPANASSSITSIKSLDVAARTAALRETARGNVKAPPSGVSESRKTFKLQKEDTMKKPISDQLAEFRATLKTKMDALTALVEKSGDAGETLDAADQEAFDTVNDEVEVIKSHIARLEIVEKHAGNMASPVTEKAGQNEKASKEARGGSAAIVKNVKNEEPGIGFAKFALAMYAAKGNILEAKSFAENKFGDDIRLQEYMKAAVAAGTTTTAAWAGNLVRTNNLSSEFLDFLRPRTIIGQFGANGVPSLRRIPFNVRIPGKTASGTAAWVGEGYAKPVTKSAYNAVELKWAKIAAISVITEELERFSDPSIQMLVRDDLAEAVIERADTDFINPGKAAGTGASLSPASITNGVTPVVATGNPECDIPALWAVADGAYLPASSAVYITDSRTARNLTQYKNALGQKLYPDITMTGGSIDGVPVIISNYVPDDTAGSIFVLAFASEIYLSDDGQVNIDVSREASILMADDASGSMNSGTPTAAALVSMFQTNSLAIRAERYINWAKRRTQAVAYLSGVNWDSCAT